MNQRRPPPIPGDSGVYLLVADDTQEFETALHYAAKQAAARRARVAVLYVTEAEDFQHWGGVQDRISGEIREQGERVLLAAAQKIEELGGGLACFYLETGRRAEIILSVIDGDARIKKLILGGGTQPGNPGPLVSYFAGKGHVRLRVPLTVVPGGIPLAEMESLV